MSAKILRKQIAGFSSLFSLPCTLSNDFMENVIYKARLEPRCSDQMEVNIILNLKITTHQRPALYNYIRNACKYLAQTNSSFAQGNGKKCITFDPLALVSSFFK